MRQADGFVELVLMLTEEEREKFNLSSTTLKVRRSRKNIEKIVIGKTTHDIISSEATMFLRGLVAMPEVS